jgi:hypothetical protein
MTQSRHKRRTRLTVDPCISEAAIQASSLFHAELDLPNALPVSHFNQSFTPRWLFDELRCGRSLVAYIASGIKVRL